MLFALYLNAGIGWMFAVILTASPIFSVIVTAVLLREGRIGISAEVSGNLLYKKETLILRVKIKNKGFLPIPVIIARVIKHDYLELSKDCGNCYAVSVNPRSEAVFEVKYAVKVWGTCYAGIDSARLQDFMRFSSFKLYDGNGDRLHSHIIKIFPDIPDIPADSPLIKSAFEAAWYNDNEDTKESDSYLLTGMPGYTHREYEVGDPIKRINWKLSAGRDNYLIRLDDEKEAIRQTVVLDCAGSPDPYVNERAVEGVLAVIFSLVRLGVESAVWYKKGGLFISHAVESAGDVVALQTAFADYSFGRTDGETVERIPSDELTSGKSCGNVLIFTPAPDRKLSAAVSDLQSRGVPVTTISADSDCPCRIDNLWHINKDYTASKAM